MKIKNFSELDVIDEEGNVLVFEDTITQEDNIFNESGVSPTFSEGERVLYRNALRKLTPRQKQVVLCIDYHAMSQEEAAEILQIERSVVSKHYKAALTKLRKFCLDK